MTLVLCDCVVDQEGIVAHENIRAKPQCPDCRGRGFIEADRTEAALEAQFEREFQYPDPKKHEA